MFLPFRSWIIEDFAQGSVELIQGVHDDHIAGSGKSEQGANSGALNAGTAPIADVRLRLGDTRRHEDTSWRFRLCLVEETRA